MITMKDTCIIAQTVSDGYGDTVATTLTEANCLFLQSSASRFSGTVEAKESDAHVYLDIHNPILENLGYRIEGMYLVINPFGASEEEAWYRITRVVVGQRKLLDNDIDNVHAYLRKVAKLELEVVS